MRDLVIIGAGPGGFDTAIHAKEHGLDVVLIEKHIVGGTCLNYGCIPTKALYHNAKNIKGMESLKDFGIDIDSYSIDYQKIKERKESIVSSQVKNVEFTLKKLGVELIEGEASILDQNTVTVNGEKITTKNIIIATGSSPKMIPFEGQDLDVIKTSKELLSLSVFPKKLVVIGAGVIGCEMAAIFNQFGAEVTVVEYADEILPSLDQEITKRARNLLKRQGLNILVKSAFKGVKKVDTGYVAMVEQKGKLKEFDTDCVLVSTGRKPNYGNLDLEEIGINYGRNGIIVNEYKQTSIPNIYAIGDVNGEMMLAHKATYDGYKVISHILNNEMNIRFDLVPGVVFTFPEIASVGKTEQELIDTQYKKNKFMFKTNAKAQCLNETDGFVKVLFDENEIFIGCHIIGPHASDLIHEATALMNQNTSLSKIKEIIHAHPTITEVLSEAFKGL